MKTTPNRESILNLIRGERTRQIEKYGTNNRNFLGFGSNLSAYPWLMPYSDSGSAKIEKAFRADYESYEHSYGAPTWMHLIREEVAELFDSDTINEAIAEAVQVAALCVSLCEYLLSVDGDDL